MTTLSCGLPPCPEHGAMCAYHGDEPEACPWCHESWDQIIASGQHTCERANIWDKTQRKWRLKVAEQRRSEASQQREVRGRATFCPHVEYSPK